MNATTPSKPQPMATTTAFLLFLLLPLLLLIAMVDLLTMGEQRRIRLHRHQGLSQQAIADRLAISRHRVRLALT